MRDTKWLMLYAFGPNSNSTSSPFELSAFPNSKFLNFYILLKKIHSTRSHVDPTHAFVYADESIKWFRMHFLRLFTSQEKKPTSCYEQQTILSQRKPTKNKVGNMNSTLNELFVTITRLLRCYGFFHTFCVMAPLSILCDHSWSLPIMCTRDLCIKRAYYYAITVVAAAIDA
jgi:hypothetical protein